MGQDVKCLILLLVIAVFFITEIIPLASYRNRRRYCVRRFRFHSDKTSIQWSF
jgi:hypothetical protein